MTLATIEQIERANDLMLETMQTMVGMTIMVHPSMLRDTKEAMKERKKLTAHIQEVLNPQYPLFDRLIDCKREVENTIIEARVASGKTLSLDGHQISILHKVIGAYTDFRNALDCNMDSVIGEPKDWQEFQKRAQKLFDASRPVDFDSDKLANGIRLETALTIAYLRQREPQDEKVIPAVNHSRPSRGQKLITEQIAFIQGAGHTETAMQIVDRFRERFGMSITDRTVRKYRNP